MTDEILDRLDTRANNAIATAVDEKWFDDESALDTIAPKYFHPLSGDKVRDPRETADAFYLAAADPRIITDMITELRRLWRYERAAQEVLKECTKQQHGIIFAAVMDEIQRRTEEGV